MSRRDRPSRKRRPGKRPRLPSHSQRTSGSGGGWHTFKEGSLVIYVNPHVPVKVAILALEELLVEHLAAMEGAHPEKFEILPQIYATAHRFRGADWFVVTDSAIDRIYIAPPDVLRSKFGWNLGTQSN